MIKTIKKVIGKMIYKMVMAWKLGLMVLNMKAIIKKEKNMDKVLFNGLMEEVTEVNGLMENNMVKVIIKVVKELKDLVNGEKVEELNG